MFSIDQNSNPLWDVVPKLDALSRQGHPVCHFIEDIDVAFTSLDTTSTDMRLVRERYYPGGGSDWGASLFYSDFLGRLPVDVRNWEPFMGMKTKVLARELGMSVDKLYELMSPSDNWQLIGPSYAADSRHHRLTGDLSVAETKPFLHELMDRAQADMHRAFPATRSHRRLDEWFAAERDHLGRLLDELADAPLVELYRRWMTRHTGKDVKLAMSSSLLACGASAEGTALLELFVGDYDRLAGMYNKAIEETSGELRPLRTAEGELPFFAAMRQDGHLVRTGASLDKSAGAMRIGDMTFDVSAGHLPIDKLKDAGVLSLAGKAIVLMMQVRLGAQGAPLALPYRGSLYTPTAVRLAEKLADADLLPAALHPIMRVRLRLLDRMAELDTPIALPGHLAHAFGAQEMTASHFAGSWREVRDEAIRRLDEFRTPQGRKTWQEASCADLLDEIETLDARRRSLAGSDEPAVEEIRGVWKHIKSLKADVTQRMLNQIARDHQAANMDYWDTRGAALPWCLALGGEEFYNKVVATAEIYPE